MHLPDGLLSGKVLLATGLVSGVAVAVSARRAARDFEDRPGALALTGVLAAFIFAAQMVNFPVLPGVSGHLLGAVLAGILLGPYVGTLAMAAVFILQALWLGDGGVLALGANVCNMGVLGTFLGAACHRALAGAPEARVSPTGAAPPPSRRTLAAAFVACMAAVLAGALAAWVQIAASDARFAGRGFLWLMGGHHLVIGAAEGAITAGVLAFVGARRPDLLAPAGAMGGAGGPRPSLAPALGVLGLATLVLAYLGFAELGSALPDGFEAAAEKSAPGALEEIERAHEGSGGAGTSTGPGASAGTGAGARIGVGTGSDAAGPR